MKISLRAARVNAELTREDVAKAIGYNTHTLMLWELGDTIPRADIFMALCALYHVQAEDIELGTGEGVLRRLMSDEERESALRRLISDTERESKNVL